MLRWQAPSMPGDGSAAPRHLVPLLAGFTSLVVLTTDLYLPVLPDLGRDLGTTDAAAAATISAVLVGVAIGQVVVGPLSDTWGRRAPLLVGVAAYAVVHLLSAVAPNVTVLLVIRVLAGLATAACLVVARAMVADVFPGEASTRAFATLGAVASVVPVLAPVVGGLLAHVMSWRAMFALLGALAVLLGLVGARLLPETLAPAARTSPHLGDVLRGLTGLVRHRGFLAHVATMGMAGAVLFGYIGASSFLLQRHFGLSPQQFSLVFAVNSVGLLVAATTTRRVVERTGAALLLGVAQVTTCVGVAVLAVGVAVSLLPLVLVGLWIAVGSLGAVLPSATALGLGQAPGRAGAAAGLLGISQFLVGALASPLAGIAGSPWSFVVVLAVAAVAGPLLRLALTTPAAPVRTDPDIAPDRIDTRTP